MKRRGKKMKKFIKYGSIVVISLVILISCNVNSYDCDVFAEEKNEEQNTETDIIMQLARRYHRSRTSITPISFCFKNHEYIEYEQRN